MKKSVLLIALSLISFYSLAQSDKPAAPAPALPYGESISLEAARKLVNAGHVFAAGKQWTVVIAIVDTGGNIVLLEKMDNTQVGSLDVALGRAKTANNFKRSSKVFEDAVAGGGIGLRVLSLPGAVAIEGGEPIIQNGKIIGGIVVSGMQSTQDEEVVKAALAVLK